MNKMNYKEMTNDELAEAAELLMDKITYAYDPNELEDVLLQVGM